MTRLRFEILPAGEASRLAWIGDAVLLLYARRRVLMQNGMIDDALCVRMTSNRFLSAVGDPTRVEAEIGRIYESAGLDEAQKWIETHLVPVYERQQANRKPLRRMKRNG